MHYEIIFAWWNLISIKLKKTEAKRNWKTRKQRQLLSRTGFTYRLGRLSLRPRENKKPRQKQEGFFSKIDIKIFIYVEVSLILDHLGLIDQITSVLSLPQPDSAPKRVRIRPMYSASVVFS